MKVFFDTNVILEYLMQRERLDATKRVINQLVDANHDLFMSAGGFYTILYVVDKFLNKELGIEKSKRVVILRNMGRGLLNEYGIAGHDNESLIQGIDDLRFSDLEDSCQLQAAISAGCQCLLTFNAKDYPTTNGLIKTITPEQFLLENPDITPNSQLNN